MTFRILDKIDIPTVQRMKIISSIDATSVYIAYKIELRNIVIIQTIQSEVTTKRTKKVDLGFKRSYFSFVTFAKNKKDITKLAVSK